MSELDTALARASEKLGEGPFAPLKRWHDETHDWPWQTCPERPCAEVREHDQSRTAEGILEELSGLIDRYRSWAMKPVNGGGWELLEELETLVEWWSS